MSPFSTKGLLLFSEQVKKTKKWNVAVQICCTLLSHLQHNVSVKYNLSHHIKGVKIDWLTLCFSLITKYVSLKTFLLFRLSSFHQDFQTFQQETALRPRGLNPFCDRNRKKKKTGKQVLGNAPSIKCLSLSCPALNGFACISRLKGHLTKPLLILSSSLMHWSLLAAAISN